MTAWDEGERRLTGPDVKAARFPAPPLIRRGYDADEVRAFLHRVAAELERCAAERAGLIAEAERLRRMVAHLRGGGVWLSGPEEAHAAAVDLYSQVQLAADDMIARAQERSAQLAEEAIERREAILRDAERVRAEAEAAARIAADAALDEPVPDEAGGLLRASRASDAAGRAYNEASLDNMEMMARTILEIIGNCRRRQAAGAVPEPDAAEPQPAG